MKSERRHELAKNDLADRLATGIETIKPYQNAILAGVLLVLVVTASYGWWVRRSEAASNEGWDLFYSALTKLGTGPGGFDDAMSDFDDIIAAHPKTQLAHWTAAVAGDLRLEAGCNQLFINKPNAKQELKHAIGFYEKLRSETRSPRLRQRAIYGLARATEATGTDLDEAKKLYKELSQTWPEGVYAVEATRRAEDLASVATLAMYDDFRNFDPKPAYMDEPGIPGERPDFNFDSLPDGPLSDTPLTNGPLSDGPESSEESVFPAPLMDVQETGTDAEPDTTTEEADPAEADPAEADPTEASE